MAAFSLWNLGNNYLWSGKQQKTLSNAVSIHLIYSLYFLGAVLAAYLSSYVCRMCWNWLPHWFLNYLWFDQILGQFFNWVGISWNQILRLRVRCDSYNSNFPQQFPNRNFSSFEYQSWIPDLKCNWLLLILLLCLKPKVSPTLLKFLDVVAFSTA